MNAHRHVTLAILGTGLIGAPIARHFHRRGFKVHAWNRTAPKAQALASDGILVFDTPADAVRDADLIVTVLKDGPSVEQVMLSAAPALKKGAIWLQLSTVGIEGIDTLVARPHSKGWCSTMPRCRALGNRLNWPSSSFWHQVQSHSEQPPRQPSTPLANGPCGCRSKQAPAAVSSWP